MQSNARTPDQYFRNLPDDRRAVMNALRKEILNNLPKGFEEQMTYGIIGYVVPLSAYPAGYHVTPDTPLPFINIASQKNHIAFYHLGMYADPELLHWFTEAYPKHSKTKLDMGKSCIRWKKPEHVPLKLIGELVKKMTMKAWIKIYEDAKPK
ncbi:DUF1801 domain-containing protein [Pollutibacter soli]|uniref:DUF1801 domain-containing protein n=1 Tax=Pollutibacter soli TaxID=3034157 RepID=UPI003013F158